MVMQTRGSTTVNREELKLIEPPKPTATWQPIKHLDLLLHVEEALKDQKIEISKEHLAVQRRGAFFFATLDLVKPSTQEAAEYTSSLGLRASNNKTMAIQIAVGARVFVCDNLAFSGDMIALSRKHTASLELKREVAGAVQKFSSKYDEFSKEIQFMKRKEVLDSQVKAMIFDCFFKHKIMPLKYAETVVEEYFSPTFDAFKDRTLWSLHNAFTYAAKELPEVNKFAALRRLTPLLKQLSTQ